MTNEDIIKKIEEWQLCDYVHGLTCGSDRCNHVLLKAVERKGIVILVCTTEGCCYEQTFIPEHVINTDVEEIKKSMVDMMEKLKRT